MNDLISVIVPVYNVEAYLPECMDSLLSQSHRELEILLIDDGSTDNSGKLCDAYGAQDERVRVIHQKNGGAAAAKNAGLRAAAGKYLAFADSDDVLAPGAYAYMLSALKETGADAGEFSFRDVYPARTEDHILYEKRAVKTARDYLVQYTEGWNCGLLWNKLYKRSLFDGVFFEEGHRIDDEYFTYQGMMNANTVVCDPKVVYHYRKRASGAMLNTKAGEQRMLDRVDYLSKRRKKIAQRYPELKSVFDTDFLNAMVYLADSPENSPKSIKQLKTAIRDYFLTSGNTPAPRHFWRGLLRVWITPTDQLLKRCAANQLEQNPEEFFA